MLLLAIKKEYQDLSTAIDKAIDYCIKQNILEDILEKHRSEVARLIFREFDEAEFLKQQQKETENLREQIRLANECAERSERQTKKVQLEAVRLRKILEEHGWSE